MNKRERYLGEGVIPESTKTNEEQPEIAIRDDQEKDEAKAEFYQDFRDNYGVSFSKDKMLESSAEDQVNFMQESGMRMAQVLINKDRKMEEYTDLLKEFKDKNPEGRLSIHSSAPGFVSFEDFTIKNENELFETFNEATEAGCDLVTIHPVAIEIKDWEEADLETQSRAIKSMASFYARAVVEAKNAGKKLELAIENLPAKGKLGKWGQTPEQISAVLEQSREILVLEFGFKTQDAIEAIGMTLDIGHALAESKVEAESVLTRWFQELSRDIKCFHTDDPTKLKLLREMCEKFNVKVPVFLESKQDIQTTQTAYISSRDSLSK